MKHSKFLLSFIILLSSISCGLFDSSEFSYGYFGAIPICNPDPAELVSGVSGTDIHINRISGELPFHVYVSASNIKQSGISHPYDQLTYTWNFGDSSSTETFTNPVTAATPNTNTEQTGPEAAYVYRTAGTYTITLTITSSDGSITTQTQTITASTWSGSTRYFDPGAGGDDNASGETTGAPWKTAAKMGEWLSGGDNRQALIKSGETMSFSAQITLTTSYIRIGSYDAGAKPILQATSSINTIITLSTTTTILDHVYTNVVFNGNTGQAEGLVAATLTTNFADSSFASTIEGMGFVDVDFINDDVLSPGTKTSTNLASFVNQAGFIRDVTFWNTTFTRGNSDKNGIYAEMREHFAVVGATFSGGDGSISRDHHIYANHVDHTLYRWIDFQAATSNNFAINSNTDEGRDLQYHLVDGVQTQGTSNGMDFSGTGDQLSWYHNVIVQNSEIHTPSTNGQGYGIIGETVKRITIRDNKFYSNPLEDINISGVVDECTTINLFRNKFWKGVLVDETITSIFQFTSDQIINMTDNTMVHEGTTGGSRMIGGVQIPNTAAWFIDRNTYYAPNLTSYFNTTNSGLLNFTEWQALGFDLNGSYSNPNYPSGSTGVFE